MRFTELKFDAASLAESLVAIKAQYAKSGRKQKWVDFVIGYIGDRLVSEPARYLEYGPYWWAVKATLATKGFEIGPELDLIVFPEYSFTKPDGQLDVDLCLVAGEQFKEMYCGTYFKGTRDFALTLDGNTWQLCDGDMETMMVR